jgi:hypothetical protein
MKGDTSVHIPSNHKGLAILDGNHGLGGPLNIPSGVGNYASIFVPVEKDQDFSYLTQLRDLSQHYTAAEWAEITKDLHVELVDGNGLVRAVQDDDRRFGSQEHIINFDTATKSKTVTVTEPGIYQFRIFSKSGRGWTGLAFGVGEA